MRGGEAGVGDFSGPKYVWGKELVHTKVLKRRLPRRSLKVTATRLPNSAKSWKPPKKNPKLHFYAKHVCAKIQRKSIRKIKLCKATENKDHNIHRSEDKQIIQKILTNIRRQHNVKDIEYLDLVHFLVSVACKDYLK